MLYEERIVETTPQCVDREDFSREKQWQTYVLVSCSNLEGSSFNDYDEALSILWQMDREHK